MICKVRVVGVLFFAFMLDVWDNLQIMVHTKMCGHKKSSLTCGYQSCFLYSGILTKRECPLVGEQPHMKSIIRFVNSTRYHDLQFQRAFTTPQVQLKTC